MSLTNHKGDAVTEPRAAEERAAGANEASALPAFRRADTTMLTDALVDMLVATRYEDLAASTVAAVQRSTLDLIGCMLAAANVPECDALLSMAGGSDATRGARVFGRSVRLAPAMAAFVNATAGRALDMDDLYEPGQSHATVAVVPVLLAIADTLEKPMTGKEFIAATAACVDLLARLSLAPTRSPNETGISPTWHFGTFAGAAAAARALGCDRTGMRNALGHALGMAGGTRQSNLEGVASIRVQQGWSAHCGVMAGLLAAQGIAAPKAVFEGKFGYYNVYNPGAWDPEPILADLGKRFAMDALTLKLYPACKYAHGAIEGMLLLRGRRPFRTEEVRRIRVRVPDMSYASVCVPEAAKRAPDGVPAAQFSLPYLTAATLIRGRLSVAELSLDSIRDEAILAWTRRIEIERDDSLVADNPLALSAAVVEVELASGEILSETVLGTAGDPQNPCNFEQVVAKVRDLLGSSNVGNSRVDEIAAMVASLESVPDIRALGGLLQAN
ncbi:MAG: MmgE/PrpD family protein [Betaproteobacteria bacterium]|nr:MmgE/PrpD family protein [Betaproteobacteria bacterium]